MTRPVGSFFCKSVPNSFGALLGRSWALFGRSLLLLGASWRRRRSPRGLRGRRQASGVDFGSHFGSILGAFWSILVSSWEHFNMYCFFCFFWSSFWAHLGLMLPNLAHFRSNLGSCWAHLGLMLPNLGHFGLILGSFWAHLGLILGTCWLKLDLFGTSWSIFWASS